MNVFALDHAGLFIATVLVVVIVPGPDVLFVVSQALLGGRARGFSAILGIQSGFCVHVCVAIAGLAAFAAHSQPVFFIIRELGAVYLIYLGMRRLFFSGNAAAVPQSDSAPHRSAYVNGFITNVSNPKAALFTYSLLPQFVSAAHGSIAIQILWLALIASSIGLCVLAIYVLCAAPFQHTLRRSRIAAALERFGIGGLFLGIGVKFAISDL